MNKVNTREGSVVDPRNRATESVRDLKLTANERKTSQKNEGGPKHSAQGTRKGRQRTGLPLAAERKSTCTSSVTPALDERRLIEEALRRSESREELLADVAGSLLASIDPQPIIDDLANKTMRFLDCEVFFNYLLDEKSDRLRLNAYAGVPKEEADRIAWLDPGVAVCGCVARDGRRIVAEDIQATEDPRMDLVRSYELAGSRLTLYTVPFVFQGAMRVGVLVWERVGSR